MCEEWRIWIWILDEFLWAKSSELCLKKRWNMVDHLWNCTMKCILKRTILLEGSCRFLLPVASKFEFLNMQSYITGFMQIHTCNRRFSCDIKNWLRWSVITASHDDSHVGCFLGLCNQKNKTASSIITPVPTRLFIAIESHAWGWSSFLRISSSDCTLPNKNRIIGLTMVRPKLMLWYYDKPSEYCQ